LSTSNGSSDVALGKAKGALEATNNREKAIVVDIPNVPRSYEGKTLRRNIGDGGQPIVLITTNGRITVRQ
jgi:hypothetical protein